MSDFLLQFEDVSVRLNQLTILDQIRASVPHRETTAIIGPNGAGKTTLLLALLGEVPIRGRIRFTDQGSGLRPRIAYVPQKLEFDRQLPLTVVEFMLLSEQRRPLWLGYSKPLLAQIEECLAEVEGAALIHRRMGTLSTGELQRVLLAHALMQNPELLLLDEADAGVDVRGGHLFCGLLEEQRQRRGFTVMMVSHDIATVTHHARHVICLNKRVLGEGPPEQVLTPSLLAEMFGVHMGIANLRGLPPETENTLRQGTLPPEHLAPPPSQK